MAANNLPKYFSQFDGDAQGAKGACGETCLKMIDHYLTGREIAISDIIKNGDNNTVITSIAGMQKSAEWLGWGADYFYDVRESDIKKWLSEGKLIVAVLKYGLFPSKYKQDQKYQSGHFVVITGITDDGKAIRFADPNFWGDRREEGWMDNNKWASYGDFYLGFYHNDGNISRNGAVLVSKKGKLPAPPTPPAPPVDPCADVKNDLERKRQALKEASSYIADLESQKKTLTEQNLNLFSEASVLRDRVVELTGRVDFLTSERDQIKSSYAIAEQMIVEEAQKVSELTSENGKLQGLLGDSIKRIIDKDVVIEAQRVKIEQLILQNTKDITNMELVRLILKRLFK